MRVGNQFEQGTVPLHLTTLPKVRVTHENLPAVLLSISDVAAASAPVSATAVGYAEFGRAGTIRVTTVETSPGLGRLHLQLLEGAQRAGAVPLELAYTGDGYRPHVTHTPDDHAISPGGRVEVTALAVLDCSEQVRRISAMWPLAGTEA
jgi:2'-5' RNA ligase